MTCIWMTPCDSGLPRRSGVHQTELHGSGYGRYRTRIRDAVDSVHRVFHFGLPGVPVQYPQSDTQPAGRRALLLGTASLRRLRQKASRNRRPSKIRSNKIRTVYRFFDFKKRLAKYLRTGSSYNFKQIYASRMLPTTTAKAPGSDSPNVSSSFLTHP